MEYDVKSAGNRLREIRRKHGVSQAKLASVLGISDNSGISRIENGKREIPMVLVKFFLKNFGLSPLWLQFNIGERYLDNDPKLMESVSKLSNSESLLSLNTKGLEEKLNSIEERMDALEKALAL